jgi:hypothetical protein
MLTPMLQRASCVLLMGALFGACASNDGKATPPTAAAPAPTEKPAPAPVEKEPPAMESIGWATISEDGTITLDLQATGPNAVGEGRLVYAKDHAQYKEIAEHVGAIKPGERKPVAPFKD